MARDDKNNEKETRRDFIRDIVAEDCKGGKWGGLRCDSPLCQEVDAAEASCYIIKGIFCET